MKAQFCLTFAISAWLSSCFVEGPLNYETLLKKTLMNPHGIVSVEASQVLALLHSPRSFNLIVFISSQNGMFDEYVFKFYYSVALLYKEHKAHYALRTRKGVIIKPVIFIHTKSSERTVRLLSHNTYQSEDKLDLFNSRFKTGNYPFLLYISSEWSYDSSEEEYADDAHLQKLNVTHVEKSRYSYHIMKWCNDRTQRNIDDPQEVIFFFYICFVVGLVALLVPFLYHLFHSKLFNEKYWLIISLVAYFAGASGYHAYFDSTLPIFGNHEDFFELFLPNSLDQYGIEGLLVVGSLFVNGALIIAFTKILKTRFESELLKFIILVCLLQMFVYGVCWMEDIYTTKVPREYSLRPSSQFTRGNITLRIRD